MTKIADLIPEKGAWGIKHLCTYAVPEDASDEQVIRLKCRACEYTDSEVVVEGDLGVAWGVLLARATKAHSSEREARDRRLCLVCGTENVTVGGVESCGHCGDDRHVLVDAGDTVTLTLPKDLLRLVLGPARKYYRQADKVQSVTDGPMTMLFGMILDQTGWDAETDIEERTKKGGLLSLWKTAKGREAMRRKPVQPFGGRSSVDG